MIESLQPNQIFVFGSNLAGHHIGGAAYQAAVYFGAEWGVGVGLTGECYAIPTMGGWEELTLYVKQFIKVAELLPQYEFLLTKIGCGIAGYAEYEIKPLFARVPSNIVKPEGW